MANSEMILRLLTDLKIEQQALREQLEKMQTALTILEEKQTATKQRAYSGRPTSFRDWRASTQKD
ncbi:preprotein translocase [Bacillus paramycoides]|uniref:Preprotein translocase n=1 Tax=Bacillus paramycoides TaxID=2026194 RepID=A0A1J9U7P4_9BACI|nr:preprotein translocase [Bacillus paramycoides]OJD74009.1 preprotein translocase [Bacillus paramycoides]